MQAVGVAQAGCWTGFTPVEGAWNVMMNYLGWARLLNYSNNMRSHHCSEKITHSNMTTCPNNVLNISAPTNVRSSAAGPRELQRSVKQIYWRPPLMFACAMELVFSSEVWITGKFSVDLSICCCQTSKQIVFENDLISLLVWNGADLRVLLSKDEAVSSNSPNFYSSANKVGERHCVFESFVVR